MSGVHDLILVAVWPWLCTWIVMGLIRVMVGYKPRYRDAYLAALLPMAGLFILRALLEVSGVISKTALMAGSVYSYASLLLYIMGFFLGLYVPTRRPFLWSEAALVALAAYIVEWITKFLVAGGNLLIAHLHG